MPPLDVAMYATLLLVCGAALLKGRRPERLAAIIMVVTFAVNFVPSWRVLLFGPPHLVYSAQTTLAIDLLQLAALLAVALVHKPAWTMFTAAFQLLATLISFIRLTDSGLGTVAYVTAQNTLWWMTMTAIAYGVWQAISAARGPAPNAIGADPPPLSGRAHRP